MRKGKYKALQDLSPVDYAKQLFLPPEEYARVVSEFNTHMSDEDRQHRIVSKAIGEYWYTVINMGFNDYIVIRKTPIEVEDSAIREWEEMD